MIALTLILAIVVGIALGLLGGGGSILMVPLLVYVAGLPAKEAIATSLVVVGVTSAVSVIGHARGGRVRWRTGLLFGAAGMVGAFGGGLLGGRLPPTALMVGFSIMMLATAAAMLRGRRPRDGSGDGQREMPLLHVITHGVIVGLVTGLVGAGGGFLVVPALALLGGLPMAAAVGTSLLVIAMKSASGLVGYLAHVDLDLPLTITVTAAAVTGSLIGAHLVERVPGNLLRRGFGWFVLLMGAVVLAQQAPEELRLAAVLTVAALSAALVLCTRYVTACPLRERTGEVST